EAVRLANDTEFGLVSFVMTESLDRAMTMSERLQAGMVGINTGVVSNPAAPFGGIKQSGLGREGGLSGIEEFVETNLTAIPVRCLAPAAAPPDLPRGSRLAPRARY